MPNMRELLDAATDDLAPLPSLAPQARRIARRRKLAARSVGAALTGALVAGGGAMLIGAIHTTAAPAAGAPGAPSGTERVIALAAHFQDEAVSALQRIWPVAGEQVKFVGKPDQTVYAAVAPGASYRVVLAFYSLPANDPQNQPHVACATDTGPQSAFACGELPNGHTLSARSGGGMAEFDFTVDDIYATLTVVGGPMAKIDARKLLTMAESAIFQQLTADAHRYPGVITPMPGTRVQST